MYQPKQPDSLSKGVTPMLLMDEVQGEGHVSVGGLMDWLPAQSKNTFAKNYSFTRVQRG